jgi:hypothetical protein
MKHDGVINFADPHQKRKFLTLIGALSEPHQIEMKPYKPRRSNRANRFWFGVIVKAFCAFMEEQGDAWSTDRAHAFIVRNVLGEVEVVNKLTGETYLDRKETHGMTTEQFSDLIERGHAWLADWGIMVETYQEFQQTENACRVSTK